MHCLALRRVVRGLGNTEGLVRQDVDLEAGDSQVGGTVVQQSNRRGT